MVTSYIEGWKPEKVAHRFLNSWKLGLPDETQDLAMFDELVNLIQHAYDLGYADCEENHDL